MRTIQAVMDTGASSTICPDASLFKPGSMCTAHKPGFAVVGKQKITSKGTGTLLIPIHERSRDVIEILEFPDTCLVSESPFTLISVTKLEDEGIFTDFPERQCFRKDSAWQFTFARRHSTYILDFATPEQLRERRTSTIPYVLRGQSPQGWSPRRSGVPGDSAREALPAPGPWRTGFVSAPSWLFQRRSGDSRDWNAPQPALSVAAFAANAGPPQHGPSGPYPGPPAAAVGSRLPTPLELAVQRQAASAVSSRYASSEQYGLYPGPPAAGGPRRGVREAPF
jgi:hypothetical protein